MTSDGHRWRARPWLALLVRLAMVGIPLAAGFAVTVVVAGWLRGQIAQTRWWLLVPAGSSIGVCFSVERLTRRLLPIAALLKLDLLFPHRAPTRFKVARQAMNVRSLRSRLQSQPSNDASTAAEAALALITALTAHDRRTRGHCERVRVFTDLLGEQLHLPREGRDKLRWVALLHDIGKLEVAAEILNKPSKLSKTEWDSVAAHPELGMQLLGPLTQWLGEWGEGVRHHHEHFDGTGYPDGLAGHDISRVGRIVAVADSFEVMTAHRAYKKPMATAAARAELARCAGTQFDPTYVRAFLAIPLPRLLWAMGPGSVLMNLPLLRVAADTANKGVLATAQSGATAMSAAAVLGGATIVSAAAPAAAAPSQVTVASSPTQQVTVAAAQQPASTLTPPVTVVLPPTPLDHSLPLPIGPAATIVTGVTGGPVPSVAGQAMGTTAGHSTTINLLSLITDPAAPVTPSRLTIALQPGHGTVVLNGDGTATYTPTPGFTGADAFTVSVATLLTPAATADVHVTVTP